MKLEIISKHPSEQTHPTPLLCVHGAWENFLPYFAEHGYEARAYHMEAIFCPQAHDMMLEPGWGTVADDILEWLHSRNL